MRTRRAYIESHIRAGPCCHRGHERRFRAYFVLSLLDNLNASGYTTSCLCLIAGSLSRVRTIYALTSLVAFSLSRGVTCVRVAHALLDVLSFP